MYTKLSILIILFLYHISVVSQDIMDERDKSDYSEVLSLYPNELVCGFPEMKKEKVFYLGLEFPRGQYLSHIHIGVLKTEVEIKNLEEQLKIKSKSIYSFGDSCSLIINYDSNLYTNAPFNLTMCDSLIMMQKLPIPNFDFLIDMDMPSEFFDKATIYLLDAEKGKFLEDNYLSINGVGLPKNWLHGYTKGLVISGKIVFYWLEVW